MLKTIAPPLALMVGLVLAWQAITSFFGIPTAVVARPDQIVAWIAQNSHVLYSHSITTLAEVLAGFAVGSLLGFVMGILIAEFKFFEVSLYPIVVASQVVPVVAIAPILIIWFGFGITSKIAVATIICFFPIVINTAQGLSSVEPDIISLAKVNNASRFSILSKVRIPFATPLIMGGLKLSSALSVVGAVVGEMVGADSGLGYLITYGNFIVNTPMMFSALFVLFVMGITLFGLVTVLQRLVSPWYYTMRATT